MADYCKKCGKEITDPEAKFCGGCGSRLDGKKTCTECGYENDAEFDFCCKCGAKFAVEETAVTDAAPAVKAKTYDVEKILEYAICGIAAALMLVTFIFTFCIGMTMVTTESNMFGGSSTTRETMYLYEYFGNVYSDIKKLETLYTLSASSKVAFYLPSIIGTVVSAGAIVSAVLCLIFTLRDMFNKIKRNKDADVAKYPVISFVVFIACATVLYSLVKLGGDTVKISFNGATVSGLVLGFILLVAYLACTVAKNRKQITAEKNYVGYGISWFTVIISAVCIFLCALCAFGITYGDSASFGFVMAMQALVAQGGDAKTTALCTVGMLIVIASVAVWSLIFIKNLFGVLRGGHKARKWFAAVPLVLSVVYLVFSILACNSLCNFSGIEGASLSYPVPIVVVVFSALAFVAICFGEKIIGKLLKEKE